MGFLTYGGKNPHKNDPLEDKFSEIEKNWSTRLHLEHASLWKFDFDQTRVDQECIDFLIEKPGRMIFEKSKKIKRKCYRDPGIALGTVGGDAVPQHDAPVHGDAPEWNVFTGFDSGADADTAEFGGGAGEPRRGGLDFHGAMPSSATDIVCGGFLGVVRGGKVERIPPAVLVRLVVVNLPFRVPSPAAGGELKSLFAEACSSGFIWPSVPKEIFFSNTHIIGL